MARAQRPKPNTDRIGYVLELGGMTLHVDVDTFTIPESAKMNACIERIFGDASEGVGVRPNAQLAADVFTACAAYVVALRQDPTLAFDDWFGRFTMGELQAAVRVAKPAGDDSPEA